MRGNLRDATGAGIRELMCQAETSRLCGSASDAENHNLVVTINVKSQSFLVYYFSVSGFAVVVKPRALVS